MKYAVLTTRHTSGFLLWDSATSDFDVASSGNTTDVCKEFVKECRKQGLAPAFYYCLWGGKDWNPNPNARALILAQLYELATQYGEIPYFWIDMMSWAPPNLSTQEIYDELKTLQPNCVVEFNQHIQDGTKIAYFPTDVVDGEMTLPPATGHNPIRTVDGKTYYLPFDYNLVSQSRRADTSTIRWGRPAGSPMAREAASRPAIRFLPRPLRNRSGWAGSGCGQRASGNGAGSHGPDACRGRRAASAARKDSS